MQLILTHENSDFDAVSSQMLAQKLYPSAQTLLAHRVNRNVSRFLTLYWDLLNFMRAEDWHRQRLERVILVDTHSLPNVRSVHKAQSVQVIDHHLLGPEETPLPEDWQCRFEATGATATILLEQVREMGGILNEVEATLALLGIYEDTGSLTYDSTTVRDVTAAAWLLSLGAKLSVVRRFLEIPLTVGQQELYVQLQGHSEWLNIQDQTILIAQASVPDPFVEEISSVAHRMREALVPDALILVVGIGDKVQVVLRSTTDHLDVGALARELGGGGHIKAAAALLPAAELAQVASRIHTMLLEQVKPLVTVEQVMSWGVELMPATLPVTEAAKVIQRLGHEGYPVVDEHGSLVGLLTRRGIDRAINHELDELQVGQVMQAGRVTVTLEVSLKQVQKLMIESGWGQIPVIDKGEQDKILGIVTRTDLINHLFQPDGSAVKAEWQALLAEMLAPEVWKLVQRISDIATELNYPLYFVGGIVRDMLLDERPNDIDMVVEGDAIALVELLCQRLGGSIRRHDRFGTAKWLLEAEVWQQINGYFPTVSLPDAIDFVTARSEYYESPSALPEVKQGSIKLDLLRRDFTINALAIRLDGAYLGQLLDYYGGQRDMKNRLIRVLHSLSFVDDPTRILRAVRLEQRLEFSIEERTEELIGAALEMLKRTTGSRIRHELELVLGEPEAVAILRRLNELDVLSHLHADLNWNDSLVQALGQVDAYLAKPYWADEIGPADGLVIRLIVWLLPLDTTKQKSVLTWLNVRRTTRQDVLGAGQVWHQLDDLEPGAKPSEISAILSPYADRPRVLAACFIQAETAGQREIGQFIQRFQTEWRHIKTALNGEALLAIGLKRGPTVGRLLEELLAHRLDGVLEDETAERDYVQRWLRRQIKMDQ